MPELRILIVDDELGMRLGAVKTLRKYRAKLENPPVEIGFEADQAATGGEALAALAERPYDILLLDYKLPDINGLEILKRLPRGRDQKVVMITAYASLDVAVSATKSGVFDFLAKPFTPRELMSVVEKAAAALLQEREASRLAREKRQVRFEFLTVLSHELKAPINAIEGYLEILRDHAAGDQVADYDPMVLRALARLDGMRKLIFDLLDLTRIESGQKQRGNVPINLSALAARAVESFAAAAKSRNIAIALNAPSPVIVNGDEGEIDIIFNNLLSNAVKYNVDNGSVTVSVTREDDFAIIRVADTGIGMSAEETAKLFGEFIRIKNAKTREIPGSGLGLSIVKRLAALYDGAASAVSDPDHGSEFTVTLKAPQ